MIYFMVFFYISSCIFWYYVYISDMVLKKSQVVFFAEELKQNGSVDLWKYMDTPSVFSKLPKILREFAKGLMVSGEYEVDVKLRRKHKDT